MNIFSQDKYAPSEHEQCVTPSLMELSLKDQELFRDRLRQEMLRRGFKKQYEFAALLGITPTYLSSIFGEKRIGARKIVDFAKRLKVPVGYLLGMEDYQDWWSLQDHYQRLPLVAGDIAANPQGRITGDAVAHWLWLPRHETHGRHNLVAVQLAPDADSMLPTLRPGDTVILDRDDRNHQAKGLYAVRLPDQESCTVKRLQPLPDGQHLLLVSDNPAYDPLPVPWRADLIIGRVIYSFTNWLR